MIPWHLYNLTPKDQAAPTIRPFTLNQTIVGVAVTGNTAQFAVPPDTIYLITAMCVSATTTVTPLSMSHRVFDANLSDRKLDAVKYRDNVAQLNQMAHNVFGSPIIMATGGDIIQSLVGLTGAGNCTSIHTVSGILVPRGNVQLH